MTATRQKPRGVLPMVTRSPANARSTSDRAVTRIDSISRSVSGPPSSVLIARGKANAPSSNQNAATGEDMRWHPTEAATRIAAAALAIVTAVRSTLAGCRLDTVRFQIACKELAHAIESVQIPLVQERLVRVVGVNDQIERHVVRAQQLHQTRRLRELDVSIVVSVHEEHRRLPRIDRGDRRRLV